MALPDLAVLVVDDDSADGTGAIADELSAEFSGRVRVLHRTGRRGLGSAYVEGMQYLNAQGVDSTLVVQMDADLSHDPQYVPALLERAATADLVIGSRYVRGGGVRNWPFRRRLLSRLGNVYVRAVTGIAVHDCTAGYRCWRRDALARLPLATLASNGYAF